MQLEIMTSIKKSKLSVREFQEKTFINPLLSIPGASKSKVKVLFERDDIVKILENNQIGTINNEQRWDDAYTCFRISPVKMRNSPDSSIEDLGFEESQTAFIESMMYEGLTKKEVEKIKRQYPAMRGQLDRYMNYVDNSLHSSKVQGFKDFECQERLNGSNFQENKSKSRRYSQKIKNSNLDIVLSEKEIQDYVEGVLNRKVNLVSHKEDQEQSKKSKFIRFGNFEKSGKNEIFEERNNRNYYEDNQRGIDKDKLKEFIPDSKIVDSIYNFDFQDKKNDNTLNYEIEGFKNFGENDEKIEKYYQENEQERELLYNKIMKERENNWLMNNFSKKQILMDHLEALESKIFEKSTSRSKSKNQKNSDFFDGNFKRKNRGQRKEFLTKNKENCYRGTVGNKRRTNPNNCGASTPFKDLLLKNQLKNFEKDSNFKNYDREQQLEEDYEGYGNDNEEIKFIISNIKSGKENSNRISSKVFRPSKRREKSSSKKKAQINQIKFGASNSKFKGERGKFGTLSSHKSRSPIRDAFARNRGRTPNRLNRSQSKINRNHSYTKSYQKRKSLKRHKGDRKKQLFGFYKDLVENDKGTIRTGLKRSYLY